MINDNDEVQWAYLLDPTFELINTAGKPLTDGYIEVYIHGTRSKYYCASDFDGTLHPFKIPLNSLGANIVLASPAHAYDVYVYNKFGSLVMSRYNVVPATGDGAVIKDVVTITSEDGTVDVTTSDQTNWDLSIKDTVDRIDEHDIVLTELASELASACSAIDVINDDLSTKKDKQTAKSFTGSQTKTITSITQNQQGVISVTYEDIDLPPEVPNVEITSVDNSVQVTETTDVHTNTKTFDLSVNVVDDALEYGQFRATNVTAQAQLTKIKGNLDLNNYSIKLKKGNSYHFTIRGSYVATSAANTATTISYIEYSSFNGININVDNTITDSQYFEISYDIYNLSSDTNYNVSFASISGGKVSELWVEVHNLNGVSINNKVYHDSTLSGDGTSDSPLTVVVTQGYTAGSGIDITNDVISTDIQVQNAQKVNRDLDFGNTIQTINVISTDGSTVRTDGFNFTLPTIQAGDGIEFTKVGNETTIAMDSEVGDVVETVEKLKQDLDTQITTNFDMPNISQVYDFADGNNWITHNGACMLYQSFTIPISHELRTTEDDADIPTLLGIYAQQSFAHKIMLALYEYTYAGEGEENGSSTYVGDTGPVTVLAGMNEFPLKNRNPSITELRSDKVYYASLYLPSTAFVTGLYLGGCPGYGNASIPAEPRLTCATENITWNGQELDLDDPTTTLNHYQVIQIPGKDPYYQYYIGPWVGGYNERWSAPRFYMQIRNGEFNEPVIPTVPFNTLGDSKLPHGGILASNLPNFSSSAANSAFRDVTPMTNVTITSFEWIDSKANAGGWEAGNCVFNSDYSTNLSGVSNSVFDLGEVYHNEDYTAYAHRITFTTPITLTAGTTYRFLCSSWSSSSDWIWSWTDPTNVFDACNNGWYIAWSQNVSRYSHIAGWYNKLYDNNNNYYVI